METSLLYVLIAFAAILRIRIDIRVRYKNRKR
jgi:hypothetical protein